MEQLIDPAARRMPGGQHMSRAEFLRGVAVAGAGIALGSGLVGCGGSTATGTASSGTGPRRGGKLTVAYIGGGSSETLNPNAPVADIDDARTLSLYEGLFQLSPELTLKYVLAESAESNPSASVWTIRLRPGVTFHDGSPLTADDVIYTFQRIADPKNAANQQALTSQLIDVPGLRKLDRLTVRIPLKAPNVFLPFFLDDDSFSIVKSGWVNTDPPNGTGAFKFGSWKPGQFSLFPRNPHYWQHGLPYVDELQLVSIPDPTARFDSLVGGQVDAIESLSYSQATSLKQSKQAAVLEAQGSNMVPIYMAVDLYPFQDNRVRQAMRLIAGRPQLVEEAQSGYGSLGNDVFGKALPDYDSGIPQRVQDIDQAKFLLKQAGHEGLSVTLYTSTVATGMLESATVFATQAAAAGVTVTAKQLPANIYFGPVYLKQNFAQSEWFTEPIVTHWSKSMARGAEFNETHWNDSQWNSLYDQLLAQPDTGKQQQLCYEMEKIEWERGGYLDWGFYPLLDGLALNVRGIEPNRGGPLGGGIFSRAWLSA
ncbi:MAG: ABC transporter substrate-binding protein [Streptosporangiaceae bacterium]